MDENTTQNLAQVAMGNPDFSILVQAVVKAGLVDVLSKEGADLTVFAPTNAAFAALLGKDATEVTAEDLPDAAALADILKYHIISGTVMEDAVKATLAGMEPHMLPTLLGKDIVAELTQEGIMLNNAKVIKADVMASNGVIHAIDAVLMPPQAD